MTFEEIKSEVLAAAKTARACDDQYQRAAKCDTMDALSEASMSLDPVTTISQ